MAKTVITGITGFIGSHLAKKLVELGHSVYGVTRPCSQRTLERIKDISGDIVLITADITDFMAMSHALNTADPDYIIHLAALTPVRLSFERPFDYEKMNYLGTMNVAHAMMELSDYKKRKMIAASTAEVYGVQALEKPLTEDTPLKPSSPYAVSKVAADKYLQMAARVYDLNVVVLRPSNTYGRKFDKSFMVEYLITTMLNKEKVYVGAPESIREYMYVDDHVNAYLLAMEKGVGGQVYNIGTGKGVINKVLAGKIARKLNYDSSRIVFGTYPPGYPLRPIISDQPFIILNSTRAQRELSWRPQVSLNEGLDRTIKHWKERA